MIDDIRASFIDLLQSADWMNNETRAKAKEKVFIYADNTTNDTM